MLFENKKYVSSISILKKYVSEKKKKVYEAETGKKKKKCQTTPNYHLAIQDCETFTSTEEVNLND